MEISYGDHPLQKLKFFKYAPQNQHTLLLIHGGAWNDTANTYNDFQQLAGFLAAHASMATINIVGINYRLTPEVVHPSHLYDIVLGIRHLVQEYGTTELLVAGHSVGATMALQLLNYRQILAMGAKNAGTKIELFDLDVAVKTVVFIDGIYNMKDLVAEYGGYYQTFVERAFLSERQYTDAVQVSWDKETGVGKVGFEVLFEKAVVVQSTEDELLSLRQTHGFLQFLREWNVDYTYYEQAWGAHEQVYRRQELANAMVAALTGK